MKTSKRQKPRRRDAARSVKHPAVEAHEKRQKSPEIIHDFRKNKNIRKKKKK